MKILNLKTEKEGYNIKLNLNHAGIYTILNTLNNKFYIGSALNLRKRRNSHYLNLINNTHHNSHLQSSFNKYKSKNFKFIILQSFEKIENKNLLDWETFWISLYNSTNNNFGYNMTSIGNNRQGLKNSKEHCKKISIANTGKKTSLQQRKNMSIARKGRFKGENSAVAVRVAMFNLNNQFIKEYCSITEAAKINNLNSSCIFEVLAGRNKQHKGFKFKRITK